jgi:hypothetical protein
VILLTERVQKSSCRLQFIPLEPVDSDLWQCLHLKCSPVANSTIKTMILVSRHDTGFKHVGSKGPEAGEAYRDNESASVVDPALAQRLWEGGLASIFEVRASAEWRQAGTLETHLKGSGKNKSLNKGSFDRSIQGDKRPHLIVLRHYPPRDP